MNKKYFFPLTVCIVVIIAAIISLYVKTQYNVALCAMIGFVFGLTGAYLENRFGK